MSTNLEQSRAAFAWKKVSDPLLNDEYKNLAKSAPALIMNNGLMQTMAYLEGKGGKASDLREHLAEWLAGRGFLPDTSYQSCMEELHQSSSNQYRLATDEAIKILRWVRQFASINIGR